MPRAFVDVAPPTLHVPRSRLSGADPYKLQRQIGMFGPSAAGMPPPWVVRGTDGELMLMNGVTRSTRIAKLAPGTTIRVEVIDNINAPAGATPTIGDFLP